MFTENELWLIKTALDELIEREERKKITTMTATMTEYDLDTLKALYKRFGELHEEKENNQRSWLLLP